MSETQRRYSQRKLVNLYRDESMRLWRDVERKIRDEYDADDVAEGLVAAQAWAEVLDEKGPLERENA